MKIYLAEITLRKTRYMGDTTEQTVLRLVRAEDDHAAIDKIDATFDRGGPGDDSVSVLNVNLSEMIE
jgi:thioester reductase-like protein